jgi:hypothetical protein
LNECRVLKYARIDRPIKYSGHSGLFLNDKEIGPVAGLIIAEPLREAGTWILHCSRSWKTLGAQAGFNSLTEAQARAERMYPGVSGAWIAVKISKAQARLYERQIWKDLECSFCGRIPPEFDWSVSSKKANICDLCIHEFQRILE